MGLMPILPSTPDAEGLLRSADMACFLAKEQGRNRVYVSRENDEQLTRHRSQMEWLSRVRDALLEGRLILDAQLITPAVALSLAVGQRLSYDVLVQLRV